MHLGSQGIAPADVWARRVAGGFLESALGALRAHHPESAEHSERIGGLAARLGAELGWDEQPLENLRFAATLHDLGKVGLPAGILRKPGPLSPEEVQMVRTHPEIGSRILGASDLPAFRLAAQIALSHHERWDGLGYPRGLVGEESPMAVRIVALVDVYDALRQQRIYRDRVPERAVLDALRRGARRQFGPRVLECFLDLFAAGTRTESAWTRGAPQPKPAPLLPPEAR